GSELHSSAQHTQPRWPQGIPAEIDRLWQQFQADALALDAGFEVWLDWSRDRLDGKPFDFDIERQWALLSKERRAQSPAEINAYLASLRGSPASKQLRRVRAIFIGHGGVGKSSLIKALHGKEVIEGEEEMTPGVDIQDARMAEEAGVFTQVMDLNDDDLTVHFWDFGGQVMAHATHQFFLRANCLYVIVLDGRPERNANEEAEYWLEHVRAFGDNAPVLIVGNKFDKMPVNLDLRTLKQKYSNIADFYPVSCTKAQGDKKAEFDRFNRDFQQHLTSLGERAERFTPAQFKVLREVQGRAKRDNFLSERDFNKLCETSRLATEGYGGRDWLLKFFDTLGVVLYFPNLPFLTDYVLNPRWLTYGVYTIMYSEAAKKAGGRISEGDLVKILKVAKAHDGNLALHFPADRCRLIADAMVAFRVAYRLANTTGQMVIPALLEAQQPQHDFDGTDALAYKFDFKGLLPRHVLPALIVEHHRNIANHEGKEIVWQNGVLLRPSGGHDAEALVKADYHERKIEILVRGSDAAAYLGVIRDSICRTLQTMPKLRFDENVKVRPDMRVEASELEKLSDDPVWADYESVCTAHKDGQMKIAVGKHMYELAKVLRVMPLSPDIQPADVFISYARENRAAVDCIAEYIGAKGHTVWYDVELKSGQRF
ncbi:MAG: COR domain-containing protein, partial [Alphaproteobacteria bacterium]